MTTELYNQQIFTCSKRSSRKSCEICSKLTVKTPEQRHWRRFCVFIVNFEHISHFFYRVSIVDFERKTD